VIPCNSINDWQTYLQDDVEKLQHLMDGTEKSPGIGRKLPGVLIVDSIMGKSTIESQVRIERTGFAGKAFPDEARAITQFLRAFPHKLRQHPFCMIAVNQLRKHKTEKGLTERKKSGGEGVNFQTTWELELSRTKKFERVNEEGAEVQLMCQKNSLGGTWRKIFVEVTWWQESDDPSAADDDLAAWHQVTKWNWHKATTTLLLDPPKHKKEGVRNIVDLVRVSRGSLGPGVYSKQLGIPKDAPVSFEEAGEILYQNEEVVTRLRRLFGIHNVVLYHSGDDYSKCYGKLLERQARAEKKVAKRRKGPKK
jgi:RecA/RadA recombinase